jgi:hypothetical protein
MKTLIQHHQVMCWNKDTQQGKTGDIVQTRNENEEISTGEGLVAYLSIKGFFNLGGTVSPKNSASSAIFNKALRTISPKYMPESNFSKICEQ